MLGEIKSMISRIAATTAAAAVAAMSAVRGASAASTSTSTPPEYAEILRLAEEKVQAATQPGAFGNGVPFMTGGADLMAVLPWIGIAIAAAIACVLAAKVSIAKVRSDALIAQ